MLNNILTALAMGAGCAVACFCIGDIHVRVLFIILWALAAISFFLNKRTHSK